MIPERYYITLGLPLKSNTWIHCPHKGWKQLNQYYLAAGESVLPQGVTLTKTHPLSSLNLALGRDPLSGQVWLVATDEPASVQTFREYAHRFQIEEELRRRKIQRFSTPTLRNSLCTCAFPTLLCSCGCHSPLDSAGAASGRNWETALG